MHIQYSQLLLSIVLTITVCFILYIKNGLWATNFYAIFFVEFFDKNFSFVIWHKLATFYYQTVFTTRVIQQNIFHILCLGIWWLHEIQGYKFIKLEYHKITLWKKNIFLCFKSALFQTSKTKLVKIYWTQPLMISKNISFVLV